MNLIPSLKDKTEKPFISCDDLFTNEELTKIESIVDKLDFQNATTENSQTDIKIRNSKIKWLFNNEENSFLYNKLGIFCIQVNDQFYNFNLSSMNEAIQYTVYEPDMHYTWHTDSGVQGQLPRKLSLTIQLSEPDEYEGGDLEIWTGGNPEKMIRKKGAVVLFPSFRLHRVTPVTKGIRKSLVVWIGGPNFK